MSNAKIILIIALLLLSGITLKAQIASGGTPLSFSTDTKKSIPRISMDKPDMEKIRRVDSINRTLYKPYRFAKNLKSDIAFAKEAEWEKTPKGWLGRLKIEAQDAKGLMLYYDRFRIPEGGKLFIYTEDKSQLLGAYTRQNNPPNGYFATEIVKDQSLIIEYNTTRPSLIKPRIHISEVGYAYRGVDFSVKGFGDSGDCEVNVNCSEGDEWQEEKRGVVRIAIKNQDGSYWCSGSLLNNTEQDYTPYLLSADHCAGDVTAEDLDQWVFYFNYEAEGCSNPPLEPDPNTMVGADKRANADDDASSGSDFFLVELHDMIPNHINAYYNGWSRTGEAAESGVGIHHPQGDIKKISTFTSKLISTGFGSSDLESHWKVTWSRTENGFGVTEGGSSGSPIFDRNGLVVGSLTGGNAGCGADTNKADYYGKFSYSWERNGNRPEDRLKDWLDPNNQDVSSLSGLAHGEEPLPTIADFSTEDTTIVIDGLISFSNLAVGVINEYKWTFEGGEPGSSTKINPGPIRYNDYGSYDVQLEVSGPNGTDTTVKEDYIHVNAKAYPNPVVDELTLDFGKDPINNLSVWVYNSMGLLVHEVDKENFNQTSYNLNTSSYDSGIYFVRVNADDEISKHKVVKRKVR